MNPSIVTNADSDRKIYKYCGKEGLYQHLNYLYVLFHYK